MDPKVDECRWLELERLFITNGIATPILNFFVLRFTQYVNCTLIMIIVLTLTHTLQCIAEDGVGTRIEILDDRGCSRDARILDNLEYLDPLTAGQTARVAKFADREVVYFECQIAITRRDRGECLRPTCDLKVVKRQQPPRLFTPQVLSNVNLNESMALEVVSELQTLDMIEEDAFDEHPVDNCFDTSIMPLLVLVVVLLVFVSFTSLLTRLFASRLDHRSSCIAQPRLND